MALNIILLALLAAVFMFNSVVAMNIGLDCPPATVCYAIDESVSIDMTEFEQQTNALSIITQEFDQLSPNSTYAAVGFSKTASIIQEPTKNLKTFLSSLKSNEQAKGGTSLGSGLEACHDLLRSVPDPRVIVLITDGMDRVAPFGLDVDDAIKSEGITIATIGVGDDVDVEELKQIATDENLYRSINDYSDFSDSIAKIVRLLCKAIPSMSASPSLSPSYTVPPSIAPSEDPSVAPTSSVEPVPSTPSTRRKCTIVECGQCGGDLECYVNSGSAEMDQAVNRFVTSKRRFCTWKRWFTDCGQICGNISKINCLHGKSFPKSRGRSYRGSSYFCSSKSRGKPTRMSSVASYKVCVKDGEVTVKCVKRTCHGSVKGLRCDSTC